MCDGKAIRRGAGHLVLQLLSAPVTCRSADGSAILPAAYVIVSPLAEDYARPS